MTAAAFVALVVIGLFLLVALSQSRSRAAAQLVLALCQMALALWGIYLTYMVAVHVEAWPFR